ncbi:MAG: hypothetical protein N4A35_11375 [Flavobacteriales bacterium]|nr:hypothetical protein [Flavobacteriales bacterium]
MIPGTPAFDFNLNYKARGIDLIPNKYGVTTTFQSTQGGRVSLYNNYRFHRSKHDYDYNSENEDNLIAK